MSFIFLISFFFSFSHQYVKRTVGAMESSLAIALSTTQPLLDRHADKRESNMSFAACAIDFTFCASRNGTSPLLAPPVVFFFFCLVYYTHRSSFLFGSDVRPRSIACLCHVVLAFYLLISGLPTQMPTWLVAATMSACAHFSCSHLSSSFSFHPAVKSVDSLACASFDRVEGTARHVMSVRVASRF